MGVGKSARAVKTTALVHPTEFAARVGAHIHQGGNPESTIGGPGATTANNANCAGDGAMSSPYGAGGDGVSNPVTRDYDQNYAAS